jgi:hypothetical protein
MDMPLDDDAVGFERLLAARIGAKCAALAFTLIITAATAEQAEAGLILVLDYGNIEPTMGAIPAAAQEPKPAIAPVIGKRQAILDQAQSGALPQAPNSPNRPTPGSVPRVD